MGRDEDDEARHFSNDPFDDPIERQRIRLHVYRSPLIWVFIAPIHAVKSNWRAWATIAALIYVITQTDIPAIVAAVPGLGK